MSSHLLLLDYGGVYANDHLEPAQSNLASLLDISSEKCCELISEESEQGALFRRDAITETDFWDRVAKKANIDIKARPSNNRLTQLWAETYDINDEVSKIVQDVRRNAPVGILTNIDRGRSRYLIETIDIRSRVDIFLPSYKYKATKHDASLWTKAGAEIHKTFGDISVLYVDDRKKHVKSAKDHGWIGIKYDSPAQLSESIQPYF